MYATATNDDESEKFRQSSHRSSAKTLTSVYNLIKNYIQIRGAHA